MKNNTLFVHDHIFIAQEGSSEVYSPGGFPSTLWNKYLKHTAKIKVLARCKQCEHEKDLDSHILSSRKGVSFIFVKRISNPIGLLLNLRSVSNKVESEVSKSDYVVARLPSENGLLAATHAMKQGKPLCIEVVGCVWDSLKYYGGILSKLYAYVALVRTRAVIKKSNYVLYVTDEYLQNKYPANAKAITVNASNVSLDESSFNLHRGIVTNNKIKFGIIGNYKTNYKGIDTAIRALSKLEADKVDFELRILGSGVADPYIQLADSLGIKNRVNFYAPVPSGKPVLDWLDNIDIYMQPSLTEGLPRGLIEAMARGCLCLGSNAGGIPELLSEKFVHKKGDENDLFNKIENLLSLEKEFADISYTNIEKAKEYEFKKIGPRRELFFKRFFGEVSVSS